MLIVMVAGEPSGDVLGADLIGALRRRYPTAEFIGVAGPKMLAAGCQTLIPIEQLSVMGFVEVLKKLPSLYAARQKIIQHCLQRVPDVYIGIDAPDFNLPIEKKLTRQGIRTVHYVSPSVWAWRRSRVHSIQRACDLLLTLFPFEAAYYDPAKLRVAYVGHPLADQIALENPAAAARQQLNLAQQQRYIAILPGSRAQEVNYLLPDLLQAAKICHHQQPDIKFLLAAANTERYQQIQCMLTDKTLPVQLIVGQTHAVIAAADVVLAASGTVTLEIALIKRPQIVTYRLAPFTWWLARKLVAVPYLALPNWLAGKKIVPELLQDAATPENLAAAVLTLLNNPADVQELQKCYLALHQELRRNASEQAAKAIQALLNQLPQANQGCKRIC